MLTESFKITERPPDNAFRFLVRMDKCIVHICFLVMAPSDPLVFVQWEIHDQRRQASLDRPDGIAAGLQRIQV